jgi:hypothetical protein
VSFSDTWCSSAPRRSLCAAALHLRCAIAHARGNQKADVWARIDAALEDADRLGEGWYDIDSHTAFGRGTIAVHAAEAAVEVDQPDTGLKKVLAATVGEVPSRERRTHYAIDTTRALHRMGKSPSAVHKLRAAAADVPYYVHSDPMARALVSEMARVGVTAQKSALSSLIRHTEPRAGAGRCLPRDGHHPARHRRHPLGHRPPRPQSVPWPAAAEVETPFVPVKGHTAGGSTTGPASRSGPGTARTAGTGCWPAAA